MSRHLRYLVPLALFTLLVAFLYRGLSLDPKLVPSPLVGKPIPKFTLTRLDNPAATISDADLKGKVSLLNVWATWCVSCRHEHETLVELAKTGQVEIYGLNYKDNREQANRYLSLLGNPYVANGFDGDGRVGIDWGVYGAPETFIIDRDGIIRHKHIGPLTTEIIQEEILPLVVKLKSSAS
jgi:cytochrome c biogenesis protein CcmG/thiol:disulfide interchange protein DsbE